MARGRRVPVIAAASAWICFLAEVPPVDALWVVPGGGIFVEGLFDRVAGLDIGRRR